MLRKLKHLALSKIGRMFLTPLFALCVAVLFCPTQSLAKDMVSSRSYWQDLSGQATFEQAQQQTFEPYEGILAKGYSNQAIWLKLHVDGAPNLRTGEQLVLRLRPSFLDHITLYDPADESRTMPRQSGDMTPWMEAEYQSLNHAFLIPALTKERDIWVRISSTSTLMIHTQVLTISETARADHAQEIWYSMAIGLIVMFWVWTFISWLNDHDPVTRAFVIKQSVMIAYTLGYFGYQRVLLSDLFSPTALNWLFNYSVIAATALSFWYEIYFLKDYKLPAWLMQVLRGFYFCTLIAAVLLTFGLTSLALELNMILIGLGSIVLLTCIFVFLKEPALDEAETTSFRLNIWVIKGYYTTLSLALWVSVFPSLGLLIGTEYGLHNLVLHGYFSGVMMTILLQFRAKRLDQTRREVSNALYLSQQQVALERQRRDEQTHFLHMLMHELKTPLAVIDMALRTQPYEDKSAVYASRAVVDMKAIIDRCVEADQLEEGNLEIKAERVQVSRLLNELIFAQNIQPERLSLQFEDVPEVLSDRQYMRIILGNLLDNALRYSDGKTSVEIHATSAPGPDGAEGVLITFSNRPGVAEWPEPGKVFQKYYRSSGAQSQSGTGLGLFLVSSLAKRIGAYCRYAPDDKRVRFVLWLPV
jgi:signal transduction histidine kinase